MKIFRLQNSIDDSPIDFGTQNYRHYFQFLPRSKTIEVKIATTSLASAWVLIYPAISCSRYMNSFGSGGFGYISIHHHHNWNQVLYV